MDLPKKKILFFIIAGANGVLYYPVSIVSIKHLEKLMSFSEREKTGLKILSGIGSGLYTLFYYETLENLSRPLFFSQLLPGIFAFFSAATFFTSGKSGTELVYGNQDLALPLGSTLYAFRVFLTVDSIIKFPLHFSKMLDNLKHAWHTKDRKEIMRIAVALIVAAGYAVSITDGVYSAAQIIVPSAPRGVFITASLLGALGIFPLAALSVYRGVTALRDRYSWMAFVIAISSGLGMLGTVVSNNGQMIGRAGKVSELIKGIFSVLFAILISISSLSKLLRSIFCQEQEELCQEQAPLVINSSTNNRYGNSDASIARPHADAESTESSRGVTSAEEDSKDSPRATPSPVQPVTDSNNAAQLISQAPNALSFLRVEMPRNNQAAQFNPSISHNVDRVESARPP